MHVSTHVYTHVCAHVYTHVFTDSLPGEWHADVIGRYGPVDIDEDTAQEAEAVDAPKHPIAAPVVQKCIDVWADMRCAYAEHRCKVR